ncbi:MAG: CocE/NonD family hydrolase [Dinghuibacter sp.]|nr:CocE/NonD family hydrolase [Dinghuibacter sp.]
MRYFHTLLLLLFCQWLTAQENNEQWIRDNYTKMERMVPMRDGIKLFTAIYAPKDNSTKHPILMMRTPYSCAPYGEDKIGPRLSGSYLINYLKKGYILVQQDVRGKWMSEGEFVDVRPFNPNKKGNKEIDEASDTYDAIDWLVKNIPHNNGNVGTFGISYPGFYATMTALSNHPALKAVSPQAPVTDWFMGDDFHHNGAFFIMDGFNFYRGFGVPRPKPHSESIGKPYQITNPDNYDFYLKTGPLKNFSKLMGDSIAFWKELYAHPNYDDWWKARNPRFHMKNIKPAMLTVGGLFDAEDCFGAWRLYEAIEKQSRNTDNRVVMGPWVHGGWARGEGSFLGNVRFGSKTSEWYQQNIEIPFFEYHLNNNKTEAYESLPEASVFITGENEWKKFEEWPPAHLNTRGIYLSENGALSWNRPGKNNSFSAYTSDPAKPVPYTEDVHTGRTREYMCDDQRFAARRPDVLTFETGPLDEDLTLTGPVVADLKVTLSTTDADFVVKIIDVFPNDFKYPADVKGGGEKYVMGGYQMLVRGEIMRGRFRNSFEQPEAFSPGKVETVKFTLPDIAHTFKKGHKLMIQVQSSWFPLADRNPQQFVDIYRADEKDFIRSEIKIHHDATNASQIILPILQ